MPILPNELVKTERLPVLDARPSGELMTIDKAILAELVGGYAGAIAAVERGNRRAGEVRGLWACTAQTIASGIVPPGCGAEPGGARR